MSLKNSVGIIGAGHLIRHMMPALVTSGKDFIVSRRGAATSAELAAKFGVTVEDDSQRIVDDCGIVILSVRPYDALDVVGALRFRDDQIVLSLCAGLSFDELAQAVAPAKLVAAMPVVAAEFGESPTLVYPENTACRALLETCGPVLALENETDFGPAATIACYYGWVQELIGEMTGWLVDQGINEDIARSLVAQMTRAGATTVRERSESSIRDLVDELAAPRSFTLKGLEVLRKADAFSPWQAAAEALFERGK